MKSTSLLLAVLALGTSLSQSACAQVPSTAPSTVNSSAALLPGETAEYVEKVTARAAKIVQALHLNDAEKEATVTTLVAQQYRDLNQWHEANDNQRAEWKRDAQKNAGALAAQAATLKVIHDRFLAALGQHLTETQVEGVKDGMTYHKVKVTFDTYCEIIPVLTEEQKAWILRALKEAREEAMDGGSEKEKSEIFKKYKGRIANYFNAQGINEKEFRDAWNAKRKAAKN